MRKCGIHYTGTGTCKYHILWLNQSLQPSGWNWNITCMLMLLMHVVRMERSWGDSQCLFTVKQSLKQEKQIYSKHMVALCSMYCTSTYELNIDCQCTRHMVESAKCKHAQNVILIGMSCDEHNRVNYFTPSINLPCNVTLLYKTDSHDYKFVCIPHKIYSIVGLLSLAKLLFLFSKMEI